MAAKLTELTERAAGLEYGINDETDAWLDYIYGLED